MPHTRVNHANVYNEEHGTGPQPIVFAHDLIWRGRLFDDQVTPFKDRYRWRSRYRERAEVRADARAHSRIETYGHSRSGAYFDS